MRSSEARRLAQKIVKYMEKRYGNAPYEDRGRQVDTIVASAKEWEEGIALNIWDHFERSLLPSKGGKE